MLRRIGAIVFNTYREAVRARILHGLFALALATGGYALIVGAFAIRSQMRVVSDLGAASISAYGIIVAVVLAATSLHRELELKTVFPILARPIRRTEYLTGKYLGTLLTLLVFIAANTGLLLVALGNLAGRSSSLCMTVALGVPLLGGLIGWWRPRWRTQLPVLCSLAWLAAGVWLSAEAADDRRVLLGSALLTFCEVAVVAAVATVFASFSSPFLTAVFTFSLFIVGRSADTLAQLPIKVFGPTVKSMGEALSSVVPNLMVYVPPRTLLTGEAVGTPLPQYVLLAGAQALAWAVGLLAVASLIFRRRDFL